MKARPRPSGEYAGPLPRTIRVSLPPLTLRAQIHPLRTKARRLASAEKAGWLPGPRLRAARPRRINHTWPARVKASAPVADQTAPPMAALAPGVVMCTVVLVPPVSGTVNRFEPELNDSVRALALMAW